MGPHGESSPVVIGEPQTPPTQLSPQDAILFDQVSDRRPFPAIQPASEDHQQHLERRGVDHEPELISRTGTERLPDARS
jgi:hypothetical protein